MGFVDIKNSAVLKITTLSIDLTINLLSLTISYIIFATSFLSSLLSFNFLLLLVLSNALWLCCTAIFRLYFTTTFYEIEEVYRRSIRACALYLLLCISLLFINRSLDKFIIVYVSLVVCLLAISRFYLTYLAEFVFGLSKFKRKVAIIGYNEKGIKLAEYFSKQSKAYLFSGFFDDYSNLNVDAKGNIVGPIAHCIDYAVQNNIREIFCTLHPADINPILTAAEKNCVRVRFVKDANGRSHFAYYPIAFIHDFSIVETRRDPLEYMGKRVKKRAFDLVVSSLAVIFILSWLIPLIAILIKLDSKGPVFFVQYRAGRNNKHFKIYKFRTMTACKHDEFRQAVKNDPRITKVGKYLRKLSLDEVPQFINVLLGNMSFTGPRPHPIKLNDEFMDTIQSYMTRHFVKPGITGLAQANGYRGETETVEIMTKRIEYDLWYIENWSLMLDVKILFMTIINLFKGDAKAY